MTRNTDSRKVRRLKRKADRRGVRLIVTKLVHDSTKGRKIITINQCTDSGYSVR